MFEVYTSQTLLLTSLTTMKRTHNRVSDVKKTVRMSCEEKHETGHSSEKEWAKQSGEWIINITCKRDSPVHDSQVHIS